MFESAELGRKVSKEEYAREVPHLREALLSAQMTLKEHPRFPVVVLISGVDSGGKSEMVALLNEWMDPRYIETIGLGAPSDEEMERPEMWRFWRRLPPKGRCGIFFGSWYTGPINDRVQGVIGDPAFEHSMSRVARFEKMLADEGALVLKFWLHLPKEAQKKRLKSLEKDPRTRWRVTKAEWQRHKMYDDYHRVSELALRHTDTAHAPWTVVEGTDAYHRQLTIGRILLEKLNSRLADEEAKAKLKRKKPSRLPAPEKVHVISRLDLTKKLSKDKYTEQRVYWQERLARLSREKKFRQTGLVAVFEGFDAAGKGGAIRRVTQALDLRQVRIVAVAAPTEEERAQPYLWRFWRNLPRKGQATIFDRSWYGRVMVERIEGFCSDDDWRRAYSEINDFEEQIAESGAIVSKFFLVVSKDEQMRRFKERQRVEFKRFKITEEDWRNRKRWDDYVRAVCDMVDKTSTDIAPWTLVPANDKLHARIHVLKTLCERIERSLDG